SRLFIYYNERVIRGSVPYDSGASLRNGIKTVASQGVCPEEDWPYDATPAPYEGGPFPAGSRAVKQPDQSCYDEAVRHETLVYRAISQNATDMKGCLASGFPFFFGFSIYRSFFSDEATSTGNVPMPGGGEE